ncbi:MAG: M24 family metallopeptidase, partial [Candidatus Altiarchaeales archaeon]|nr:M24 family metallopeptidase [Candidatus Altiarchaeales archaeon]
DLYNSREYPFEVRVYKENAVKQKIKTLKCRKLGVENLSASHFKKLKGTLECRLKQTDIVEEQRAVKTGYEIEMLNKAAAIASGGMKKAYSVVKKGVRELDAVAEIEHTIRKLGSETPPFQHGMLLASGKNGADIHAHASRQKIEKGLVVVDLGGRYQGYYSDMTRTLAVGKISKKEKELVEFIRNLQLEAVDRIHLGMEACEIHHFIESRLEKKGFKFYHSAGHGVGLDVHEKPTLSSESRDILKENMVFTVEPGVYIPNKFGIRFEDMILLTKKGCKTLTK